MTADCLKLTSYFGERHRSGGSFTADALIELYGRHEIAASILLRGTEGFGLKHHLRTDRSLTLSEDLPLIAIAVDTRSRIETVLAPTVQLNRTGLVTLERARLLTDVTGPGWSAEDQEAAKLTIYLGRQERVDRVPAFIAVCDLLHRRGIDGATALLGVDGTAHGRRERAAFFSRNAEVPMMVIAVGSGNGSAASSPNSARYCSVRCSPSNASVSASGMACCSPPLPSCPAPMTMAWRCGTSSWSTPPKRSSTTGSRSTVPSSAGCARPGSAAPPPSAASGAFTATTRRTATVSAIRNCIQAPPGEARIAPGPFTVVTSPVYANKRLADYPNGPDSVYEDQGSAGLLARPGPTFARGQPRTSHRTIVQDKEDYYRQHAASGEALGPGRTAQRRPAHRYTLV